MKPEGRMGPEAALLCVRLAEYRCGKLNGDRAPGHEDSIYVAAAAYARPQEFAGPGRLRGWGRLRAALRPRRAARDDGVTRGVWVPPAGGTLPTF